jgi:hypothetical protein
MEITCFNPRSPCGERLKRADPLSKGRKFQSTLSVWRATFCRRQVWFQQLVSIHALRVESDMDQTTHACAASGFNPRSPCGERLFPPANFCFSAWFQSTLSVWRATTRTSSGNSRTRSFNPRSPCGERPLPPRLCRKRQKVSIHALRVESDPSGHSSTHQPPVSIHALRVESDQNSRATGSRSASFNPRSPCGERRHEIGSDYN